jgi:DNA-binding XRE family transcriptional regulator
MLPEEFKSWREAMGWNRTQAANALGVGRNTPRIYETEGANIPASIELACWALVVQFHGAAMSNLEIVQNFKIQQMLHLLAVVRLKGRTLEKVVK